MTTEKGTLKVDALEDVFGTDTDVEETGAWMDVPGKPGTRVRLLPQWCKKARNLAIRQQRKHAPLYRVGKQPDAAAVDADMVELLQLLVVAWEGMGALACTKENIAAVMKRYPAFMQYCLQFSDERENYREQTREDLEGNSSQPSA